MYNGIGLTTPRGSGTNGYVQRNWAGVRKTKDSVNYRTEEEIAKLDSASNKQPNREILDHERKRKIEVKCAELEDSLEEQGLPKEEIAARVAAFRAKISTASTGEKEVPRDEFGRVA
uniref:SFRICE_022355 n=1 Tax=Spodoptera frugiperda TaxID=7108 RepID=A0A2H1VUF8_SPOFR